MKEVPFESLIQVMKIHMPQMTQTTSPGSALAYMLGKAIKADDNTFVEQRKNLQLKAER